ncbi:nucleocapsid [Wuhan Louse Fly Virus 9]|uniref:Nucleoprotein n=1 Tax=Wuhan Louse Fly Virus 9 TaxID=1608123 RepID=A0A0B5KXQ9_9RHAB|nr:nucleocapsid [Wuhan Louse Fly Virus 9]AJG39203.1 nucleocapsid [Wuhan Louse Fly Virus 9]
MSEVKICDFETGDIVEVQEPEFAKTVEYPKDKFIDENSKPQQKIRGIKGDLTQLRSGVFAFIKGERVAPSCISNYIYEMMSKVIQDTLYEDWVSYTIKIPKGKVHPSNLVSMTIDRSTPWNDLIQPEPLDDSADEYLLLSLMCMYRFVHAHEKQREYLVEKIKTLLTQVKVENNHPVIISSSNANLVSLLANSQIDFMAAALDMFLEKFPKNQYARIRFGTIITRYQGCSGYANLSYFKNVLGLPHIGNTLEWFFCTQIKKEVKQMVLSSKEEWATPHSYLPYMMALQLSQKSPFSANNNPSTHMLIHLVGTLLGSNRSRNAILVENISYIPVVVNSVIVFLAHKGMTGLSIQYASVQTREAVRRAKERIETLGIDTGSEKMSAESPMEWFDMFKLRNFRFTSEEIQEVASIVSKIEEPRSNTIGEWASKNLVSLLSKLVESVE